MNKKRLLKLADFLETVPDDNFAIRIWQLHKTTAKPEHKPGECGFTGCAIGWAAHAKLVPGLTLKPTKLWDQKFNPHYTTRRKKSYGGWLAVKKAFGISEDAAVTLFHPAGYGFRSYVAARHVAKRIRVFVAEKGGAK